MRASLKLTIEVKKEKKKKNKKGFPNFTFYNFYNCNCILYRIFRSGVRSREEDKLEFRRRIDSKLHNGERRAESQGVFRVAMRVDWSMWSCGLFQDGDQVAYTTVEHSGTRGQTFYGIWWKLDIECLDGNRANRALLTVSELAVSRRRRRPWSIVRGAGSYLSKRKKKKKVWTGTGLFIIARIFLSFLIILI